MILGEQFDGLGNIVKAIRFEPLAIDPPTSAYPGGISGAIYYNTTSGINRIHNGTEWINIVKINGTAGRTTVTYSGNPTVAVVDIDDTILNNYLPLSGGNVTGTISAVSFVDTNFVGNRALQSDANNIITESNVTNTELSYLTNVSANIQTQINQLSQLAVSGNGAGTPNTLTKFVTSSSMGNSTITDTGSLVTFTTPVSSNNTITAPNFTGLASRATSALQSDTLKTSRNFSLSGAVTSNVVSFNGSGNVVLSATLATGINATNIADGSISNTEFQYLNNVSANIQNQLSALSATKANSSVTITTTSGLTGGGNLTTNRTIGLVAVGTSGTYSNIVTNAYGQVTSARALISADIPVLPPSNILQDLSNRFVTDTQINNWISTSSTVQSNSANWNSAVTSAHNHSNKSTLDLINQSLNTSATVAFSQIDLGKGVNVGSTSNSNWLKIADFTDTSTGSSRKYYVSLLGGDWADNGKIDYLFDTYSTGASQSAFSIERIGSTWRNAANEIYSDIEFKTFRENSTNDYTIYVRGTSVAFFTLAADVKFTQGSNGLFQYYVQTSADVDLPTSATHTEIPTTVHEQPIIVLNDKLYLRNTSLVRGEDYNLSDPTQVASIEYDGTFIDIQDRARFIASTSADSSIRILPGDEPNSPGSGDFWNTGAYFKWRNNTGVRFLTHTVGLSANYIPKATGDGILANSIIQESGSTAIIPNISATTITVGSIDNTEFGYLNGTSANIQTQINNLQYGIAGRFSSAINIVYGSNSITVNHNLGYLRPNVMLIDENDDQIIIVSPVFISTNQLVLPITSNRAITGARLEVSV